MKKFLQRKREKNHDRKFHDKFSLNENLTTGGESVIDVRLEKLSDAYSPFSPRTDHRISPKFLEYLEDEFNNSSTKDCVIVIKNDELKNSIAEQKLFINTLHNKLTSLRIALYKERNKTLLIGIGFLLVLISLSPINWFVPLSNVFFQMLHDCVLIIQWVFGWIAIEKIIFGLPIVHRYYKRVLKLSLSRIEFI